VKHLNDETSIEEHGLKSQTFVYVILGIIVYLAIFYFVKPFPEAPANIIAEIVLIVLAGATAVAFTFVARQFKWLNTRQGQIFVLLVIGFIIWTIAESLWMGYELAPGVDPYPSIADIFYIGGYIPLALALILNIRTIKMKFKTSTLITWIVLSLAVLVVILGIEVIPILLDGFNLANFIVVLYPLEDCVIITLALVVLLKFRAGEVAKPWGLIILGFFLESIGDIIFAYVDWYETSWPAYNLYDLFFALGYVAYIASALYFLWIFKKE
jgi:hypothetical protein